MLDFKNMLNLFLKGRNPVPIQSAKRQRMLYLVFCGLMALLNNTSFAQNPIIRTMYSADPSARVFGDKVYVYPSHDILATPGKGRPGWFAMEDYHVYSSTNLSEWTDHGMIVTQNKVPWVKPDSYSMWAPDCIYKNGKYYFYFPSSAKDTITYGKGFRIGVAIADKPEGPFAAQPTPIENVLGIDPNVMIDKDGQAYLYWSQQNIYAARLNENMTELASAPVILKELPTKGLKEGPFMFERNGLYYLTYPHVENKIERLEYAIGKNPLGPFTFTGVIMDESPTGCWTNHHSLINFKDQWYLFYHHNDYSPEFDKNRSVRIDSLSFNADGTINTVQPTLRGVGLTNAHSQVQVDRYSSISDGGAAVSFLDTADHFKGWKTVFHKQDAWLQYNSVEFPKKTSKISVRALSTSGGELELRLDQPGTPAIATIKVPAGKGWQTLQSRLLPVSSGVHHLIIVSKSNSPVELDWVRFE